MANDPGGNFASDEHRRVMAVLANPDQDRRSADEVAARVDQDDHLDLSIDGVVEVLEDLEADGDATQNKAGWTATKAGLEVLTGPIASDGGRTHEG